MIAILEVGLAVFAIAYMVRNTDGPFDIFFKFRELFSLDPPETNVGFYLAKAFGVYSEEEGHSWFIIFMNHMIDCFWCFSFWVSLLVTTIHALFTRFSFPFLLVLFGAVTISGLIFTYVERSNAE